jgi:hypothetical protein
MAAIRSRYEFELLKFQIFFDNTCFIFSRFLMAVFSHTPRRQIASFCASFVVSSYWLLLWVRFKRRWQTSLVSLRNVSPSSDGEQRPRAKIWRHFGAFAALVCAGVIALKFEPSGVCAFECGVTQ